MIGTAADRVKLCQVLTILSLSACRASEGDSSWNYFKSNGEKYYYSEYRPDDFRNPEGRVILYYSNRKNIIMMHYLLYDGIDSSLLTEGSRGLAGEIIENKDFKYVNNTIIKAPSKNINKWNTKFRGIDFQCNKNILVSLDINVKCRSKKFSLSYGFNSKFGVYFFDDFCESGVCRYRLHGARGLMSID